MRKENLKTLAVILVLVVITSVLGATILIDMSKNKENNGLEAESDISPYEFWRYYDITLDSPANYTVLLPVVLDNSGVSAMMKNLSIKGGNGTFKIVNSTYGPALMVNGSGKMRIESEICVKGMWKEKKGLISANISGTPINITNLVITLSMTEFRTSLWDWNNNTSVEKTYNTTDPQFRNNSLWKYYIDEPNIFMPHDGVTLHSFVYVKSEKAINISLELTESLLNRPIWNLSGTFTENGWHYVELKIEEGPPTESSIYGIVIIKKDYGFWF